MVMIIPSETNYKKIMAIYIMIYIWISKNEYWYTNIILNIINL